MRAIVIMYDSLSKGFLSTYGATDIKTPNFDRLAERSIQFDNYYVGSMPCIPARRELHTGRYNFLHRGWGPLEPFDDSMPEILKNNGIYTHLVTDHYHYFEDGGCTYHNRFSSWECFRGQEADPWKGSVAEPEMPLIGKAQQVRATMSPDYWRQYWVNRKYIDSTEKMPQSLTFNAGLEFIDTNQAEDNWLLQIETFDPHEPFHVQQEYLDKFEKDYDGEYMDWPAYVPMDKDRDPVEHVINEYSALVTMCDDKLGLVLDAMDRYDMWKDTMLIVNTDHGFLLGEHEWWGKNAAPMFNEIACVPFYVHDPRHNIPGNCKKLVQGIDIVPTLLDFFGLEIPEDVEGKVLSKAYVDNETIHDYVLYGQFGGCVNITDGRYTYMRAPRSKSELYSYTLMPTNIRSMYSVDQFYDAEMTEPFSFTKGARVMKIKAEPWEDRMSPCDMLFDLKNDPSQEQILCDEELTVLFSNKMREMFKENDAPEEMYTRMGLDHARDYTIEDLRADDKKLNSAMHSYSFGLCTISAKGKKYLYYIYDTLSDLEKDDLAARLKEYGNMNPNEEVDERSLYEMIKELAIKAEDIPLQFRAEDYLLYLSL